MFMRALALRAGKFVDDPTLQEELMYILKTLEDELGRGFLSFEKTTNFKRKTNLS
jgi:hypothetical protein